MEREYSSCYTCQCPLTPDQLKVDGWFEIPLCDDCYEPYYLTHTNRHGSSLAHFELLNQDQLPIEVRYQQYCDHQSQLLNNLKYPDCEQLKIALDQLPVPATPAEVEKVTTEIRPISPKFCAYDRMYKRLSYHLDFRNEYIERFRTWCLPPSVQILTRIQEFIGSDTVLEVGAGAGLWGRLLQLLGIPVIQTDKFDFQVEGKYWNRQGTFTYSEIETLTTDQAVQKYGGRVGVLLGVWQDVTCSESAFQNFTGKKVINVGELDGCTANTLPVKRQRDDDASEDWEEETEDYKEESEDWEEENKLIGWEEEILTPEDWYGFKTMVQLLTRTE